MNLERNNIILSFWVPLAVSVGLGLLCGNFVAPKYTNSLFSQVIIGVITFVITWAFVEILVINLTIKTEYNKNIKEFKKSVEKIDSKLKFQLSKLTEQTALFTESNVLEEKLNYLKKIKGASVWVVSKFISKQIAKNLKDFKFKINASEYSNFSYQIYFEPNYSLYLTSSINFYAWFKVLLNNDDFINVIENIYKKQKLTANHQIPAHIKAWQLLQITKKRLIIFSQKDYNSLFVYKPFFEKFIEITVDNKSETTKFIDYVTFKKKVNSNFEPLIFDYAIFDNNVLLRWTNPVYEEEETNLEIDTKFDSNSTIIKIFENNWDTLEDIQSIESKIDKKRKAVIEQSINARYIDHKYSYFAYGAEIWKEINQDTYYILGKNEQEFIKKFIKGKINKDYEIFHLGSGGGEEIKTIFNSIPHNHINSYSIVDISPDVLNRAKETVKSFHKNTQHIKYIEADLLDNQFTEIVKQSTTESRLFLLVANGYLLSNDKVLDNISKTMTNNDILIITVENGENINEDAIISSYKTDNVIKLFNLSLNIFDIYCTDDKYFEFEFNRPDFIGYFEIKDWINANSYKNDFVKNKIKNIEKIKIFTSFKPNSDQLINRLKKFNLVPLKDDNSNDIIETNNELHQVGGIFINKTD